ncbi:PASTA domain-containing protein [Longimicrobium terrae]|uniref:Beta-lactam-binding protein with PASTA domain n=1 Tax=Longimicrobium terrae TaxID=1639882 RepID=A0A841H2N7_9BACT|nr:beta-lactam-binding protein with PASTA domain [Longimicrobium terrae]MBB6072425.1 beta-lactam-binding protein with PASTA domain [Longimicrobium terrae]NNC32161.1 PASTA domain-containing protein [Longimicrobium terrae]
MKPPRSPGPARFRPSGARWHREIPARVRRYFDERRLLKYVLTASLGGFVLGYLLITIFFFPGFGRSAIVTVPDLTNRPQGEAQRTLGRLGLVVQKGGTVVNARIGRGRVLMQTPLPGEEVSRGATVRIVVSGGPEMRKVPSVAGMTRAEAIETLQRYGFRVGLQRVRDRREEGALVALRPAAGQPAAVSSMVVMVISAGPPKVLVPSVVGLTTGDVSARLQAVSLEIGRVSYDPESAEPAGTVVRQSPVAGDSLAMGSGVRITLAGADPNPPPPATVESSEPEPAAVDTSPPAPVVEEAPPPPEASQPTTPARPGRE